MHVVFSGLESVVASGLASRSAVLLAGTPTTAGKTGKGGYISMILYPEMSKSVFHPPACDPEAVAHRRVERVFVQAV